MFLFIRYEKKIQSKKMEGIQYLERSRKAGDNQKDKSIPSFLEEGEE